MRSALFLLAVVLSMTSAILADAPGPDKPAKLPKSIDTSLSIRIDRYAREARLIIPRDQIKQLRADLEQIDEGSDNSAAAAGVFTRTQTIVSGTLLSLAFVFGGFWLVRSGRESSKIIVTAAVLLTVSSVATLVYGNVGPPQEARSISGRMFTQSVHMYKGGWGDIKLEVSGSESNPVLIVPDTPKKADE